MKLAFGDLLAKSDAIEALKRNRQFAAKVEAAMAKLGEVNPLPSATAGLYDYPYGLHGLGITALREARNRIARNRAETDGDASG